MKIGIIADEMGIESGTGRYVHELITGLNEKGIIAERIFIRKMKVPYGDAINHVFRLPYSVLKKCSNYDLLHASNPITGLAFPFIKKIPKIITYHDLTSLLCEVSGAKFHVRAFSPLFLKIGKYSDRIIAISTQTKKEIIDNIGIPENKITVINLGVDEKFMPIEIEEKEYYVIGYVGAFNKRKTIDFLIKAFYNLKIEHPELKVKLNIWGSKNLEFPKLAALVEKLELSKEVEFKGLAPEKEIVKIYNSFDVFVMPSEWEGFCIPILEAQGCGVPVIVREDARIPEEVRKYCIKAKSKEDMADKMYELLTDSSLRCEVARNGQKYRENFTWKKTIERTLKVYEEIC